MGARKSKDRGGGEQREQPTPKSTTKRELDLSTFPARVDKVNVSGLERTKDDYVQRVTNGLFKTKTFQELILECNKAWEYLNDLGIYKQILVHIDISRGEKATSNGYEITFEGVEFSRIVGEIGTEIYQNESAVTIELASPNILGRGEHLNLQASYSSTKTTDISLKLGKPFFHTIFGDYKPEISLALFQHLAVMPISAYRTRNIGLLADFSFLSFLPFNLVHSLQYEMSFRELFASKHSPFFVRENCGPRMASLFRTTTTYDQRDSIVFPTEGFHLKLINEFSGFGGDMSYIMNNIHAEYSIPLIKGFVAQICSKFGIIHIQKNAKNIPISSLFYLGGPLNLRGFEKGGACSHIDGYACGSHTYWALGMHLWSPLPFSNYLGRFSNNFRTHLFYNFGNSNSFSTEKMRAAAGFGIAYRFAERARIELNYCFPLDKLPGDRIRKGIQFGIGYEFI